MKEIKILSAPELDQLHAYLGFHCQLALPDNDDRLGRITFHIYEHDKAVSANTADYVFQIRWGMRKIFHEKHVKLTKSQKLINVIEGILKEKCQEIRDLIVSYCQEQLETFINMELEPLINTLLGGLHDFKLGLSKNRKPGQKDIINGWPNYSVFIAWTDEFGDFQEFLYPLRFSENKSCFNIPADSIAREFRKYRDSII